jgi:hypothetical protein
MITTRKEVRYPKKCHKSQTSKTMISTESYYSDNAASTRVLDALEGHQTDKDFREMIEKNKFLHDCKSKGFKHLAALGCELGKTRLAALPFGPADTRADASEKWHQTRKATALEAKRLREAGLSYRQIFEETGMRHNSCLAAWKRYSIDVQQPDVSTPPASRPSADRTEAKRKLAHLTAEAYRKGGITLEQLSRKYKVHRTSIKKYWKMFDLNVKLRSHTNLADLTAEKILKLCNEDGYRPTEVARMFGATREPVSRRMKEAGYSYDRNKNLYIKTHSAV